MTERVMVVDVADWPAIAAGCPPEIPAAVVANNDVVAATPAARSEGVMRGLRRREAQRRCPELEIVPADEGRDARKWESAVTAVEAFTTGVEILFPGRVVLATRGPSRYFGGDRPLGEKVAAAVEETIGRPGACRVGVADGRFAATLATSLVMEEVEEPSTRRTRLVTVIPPGESGTFLEAWPVNTLERPELADLLGRLGLRTLGAFAALKETTVLARFGSDGQEAWRLARGLDSRPVMGRDPPPDLVVAAELDPPSDRVDTVAFVGKALADELYARFSEQGLACTGVAIGAETEHGESLLRRWSHDKAFTAGAIADRVRWQLEGWLAGGVSAGVTLLRLAAQEVHPDNGRQLGLWGTPADVDARIARSLARVQGILGPEAVVTAVLTGGRDPASQVRLVPWGDPVASSDNRSAKKGSARSAKEGPAPWPGRLPGPAPALVHSPPRPAEIADAAGNDVVVNGRGETSASPSRMSIAGGPWVAVLSWAGPWPLEEKWWDDNGRRRARLQIVLADGSSLLVAREGRRWWVEATYD